MGEKSSERDKVCAEHLLDIVCRHGKGLTGYVREKMAEAVVEAFGYGRMDAMDDLRDRLNKVGWKEPKDEDPGQ